MGVGDHAEPKAKARRVFIVDDHPIVREGLRRLLEREADLEVCGGSGDVREAFETIAALRPDAAVVDLSLGGASGFDLIHNLKTRYPDLPVLVLSIHDELLYAERVLRAGASGYIMKGQVPAELLAALRRVLGGRIYVSETMTSRMVEELVGGPPAPASPLERLSNRELEVLELIGKGKSTRKIAELLHISPKTVEAHRAHIKDKLKLKDATELLLYAAQWVRDEGRA